MKPRYIIPSILYFNDIYNFNSEEKYCNIKLTVFAKFILLDR